MLIVTKHGYHKKYVYGGSGIFDTVGNVLTKLVTHEVTKKLAADTGKQILGAVGKKAGEKLIKKLGSKKLTPQFVTSVEGMVNRGNSLTPKSVTTLQRLTSPAVSLDNLIAGSGQTSTIQDLARELNGGGLKAII